MHRVGIESDQLVYDYLSRVGDLAQQQQLSSGARMRLVSTLRGEIDRRRTAEGADSPAAVRRIIGRLGSPDELVAAAARSADGTVPLPSARTGTGSGEPQRRTSLPRPRSGLLRKGPKEAGPGSDEGREATAPPKPKPKAGFGRGASRRDPDAGDAPENRTEAADAAAVPRPGNAPDDAPDDDVPVQAWPDPSAPHMLGQDQRGGADDATDWWRLEPGPFDEGTSIPGFFGGIEAPELLGRRPKPVETDKKETEEEGEKGDAEGADSGEGTAARRRALRLVKLRRRKAAPVVAEPEAAPGPRRGFAHPLLLLAAVLLIAGVVTGSWLPLAGGWLIAYSSRTLSRTEAKWAALGLPGVVAAGALVWVWGRMEGRWGEPIREGAMRDVLLETWPVVVRVAAVASALYLVWRARRS
ncbi:hypothetical protein [Streptomyces sp. PTY087I2]|uniref:hypothetical protein n=1 Tax=Streptomyces sp. PTY087I2 TaxID=1819298 RepID=UPI000828B2B8|nr:hypothetical protein [Streptomyces sp. PTY087I2]OCC08998.1 hypothetical protein A3Q37_05019 [Streptomyces sp. PTY087I2]